MALIPKLVRANHIQQSPIRLTRRFTISLYGSDHDLELNDIQFAVVRILVELPKMRPSSYIIRKLKNQFIDASPDTLDAAVRTLNQLTQIEFGEDLIISKSDGFGLGISYGLASFFPKEPGNPQNVPLQNGSLHINLVNKKLIYRGRAVALTVRPLQLLNLLNLAPNHFLSFEQLRAEMNWTQPVDRSRSYAAAINLLTLRECGATLLHLLPNGLQMIIAEPLEFPETSIVQTERGPLFLTGKTARVFQILGLGRFPAFSNFAIGRDELEAIALPVSQLLESLREFNVKYQSIYLRPFVKTLTIRFGPYSEQYRFAENTISRTPTASLKIGMAKPEFELSSEHWTRCAAAFDPGESVWKPIEGR